MSDINKMDDFFKEGLGDYSPDVPPQIWDNIIAERKRRKPVAFWQNRKFLYSLAALLLLLGGGIALLNSNNNFKSNETADNNRQSVTAATAQPFVVSNPAEASTANRPAVNNEVNENNDEINPVTANNNANTVPANTEVNTKVPLKKSNENKKPALQNSGDRKIDMANNVAVHLKNSHVKNKFKKSKGKITISTSEGSEAEAGKSVNENEIIVSSENKITDADETEHGIISQRISFIATKISSASLMEPAKQPAKFQPFTIPDCPAEKDAAGNKLYWELYAGPDYAIKKYHDTANSTLLQKRKESISFQSAYSAGVRFTRVFSNGISIRGGINYSQINEKFSFVKDNVVQLTYVINANGDTTDSYYVRGTRYSTAYNHYRTIDIPVVIGYELGNGRLHANINAGAVVNLHSWQKGETVDLNYMPVSFSSGKNNTPYQYKTNVGIGFMGAVSFYYKLNDRLHLLAEPYYRYNFSPINAETLSIQEKFSTMGLRLGLRWDLR